MQAAPPPEPPSAAIIVTAKALPDPAAEQAYGVDRIDAKALKNAPSTQLDQVLKDVSGLQLFRRSDARSAHPTSQGVTLRALGGNASSRALLILDGVPQADPFGGWVNWPAYDPASLAEVRVVRGGGSVANGPGALGGTIEMRSRLGEGLAADAKLGSRRVCRGEGTLRGSPAWRRNARHLGTWCPWRRVHTRRGRHSGTGGPARTVQGSQSQGLLGRSTIGRYGPASRRPRIHRQARSRA